MSKEAAEKVGVLGRRSERVLLKIPIKVQGTSAEGKPFGEDTYTLVINRHGARITLQTPLLTNTRITITNKYNNLAAPFRVVVRTGKSLGEGPEWGVECLEPDTQFWGIYFPQKKEKGGEGEPIDALLECTKCSSRELAQLGPAQYEILTTRSSLSRECRQCKTTTEWRFSFVDEAWEPTPPRAAAAPAGAVPGSALPTEASPPPAAGGVNQESSLPSAAAQPAPVPPASPPAAPPAGASAEGSLGPTLTAAAAQPTPPPPAAPPPAAPAESSLAPTAPPAVAAGFGAALVTPAPTEDQRRVKRVTLKLPVRVRHEDGRQDVTRTENYSKLGACVISSLDLKENDRVLVTVGYTGGSSDLETPARVVWRRPMEGTKMTAYGMEFLKSSDK